MDEMLSGDAVTVSVNYSRVGDTQAVATLATYDEYDGVWTAAIPNEYLTRHVEVNVHVHTYYGSDGEQERGKTMFEGVFVPIRRAAPYNTVTDDQHGQWENLLQEVQLVLAPLESAAQKAAAAVAGANEAAGVADESADDAQEAARIAQAALGDLVDTGEMIGGMAVVVTHLAAGSAATARRSGHTITLGLPRGNAGGKGTSGDTNFSDISISMNDGVLEITPK